MTRLACLTLTLTISASFAASFTHGDRSLQTILERKITVTENKSIFTLFCLLNLGGYDAKDSLIRRASLETPESYPPSYIRVWHSDTRGGK